MANLATAAGAQHVFKYKDSDVAARIRDIAADGVDVIVEVGKVLVTVATP